MESAALLEAVERGDSPFPVLRVTWVARGYSLDPGIYASVERHTAAGQVTALVESGGWGAIQYGSGVEGGSLEATRTSVGVIDTDGALLRMLETYDPRGSAAAIDWAAPGLVTDDWEPVFVGVVEDWERTGLVTRLLLKTDDAVLRTPVPAAIFKRTEWGSAEDGTIFGTHVPLVMGIHDAYRVTARGMVPAINIRYDKDIGYWWLASVGHQVDIRRLHYDGEPQEGSDGDWWHIRRGVWGQNLLTIITIDEGYQPAEGVIVAFDCEGPDANGLYSGSAITSPVLQLRAVLEEYVYRDAPLGAWRGDHSIIDDTSWDAAATFFEAYGHESARRWGADQSEQSAAEVIQSFLDAFPWTRIHWTPLGTLAFVVLDPEDADPDAGEWLDLEQHHEGAGVPYAPGDRREVYTHVSQPYMFSAQEQKYLSAYEAHDVAALDETVLLTLENPWSQGRYIEE